MKKYTLFTIAAPLLTHTHSIQSVDQVQRLIIIYKPWLVATDRNKFQVAVPLQNLKAVISTHTRIETGSVCIVLTFYTVTQHHKGSYHVHCRKMTKTFEGKQQPIACTSHSLPSTLYNMPCNFQHTHTLPHSIFLILIVV